MTLRTPQRSGFCSPGCTRLCSSIELALASDRGSTSAPIVQRDPLQRASLQHVHIAAVFAGDCEQRSGKLDAGGICVVRIGAKVAEISSHAASKACRITGKASGPNDASSMSCRACIGLLQQPVRAASANRCLKRMLPRARHLRTVGQKQGCKHQKLGALPHQAVAQRARQ
jgi:hypothetical protein